jgi:plasmid stabilization system protein ParE
MRAVFHPHADQEMVRAARWYENQRSGLGKDFLDEVEAAVARVRADPSTYAQIAKGIRQHLVHRFPYAVLYRLEEDRVYILAVMHLHRDPEYWQDRL